MTPMIDPAKYLYTKYCPKCRVKYVNGNFCKECGTELEDLGYTRRHANEN